MPAILFVHGMFLTPRSWEPWQAWFNARGYECVAPAWPLHDAEPAAIRAHPPAGLGALSLAEVLASLERAAEPYRGELVIVGHSVGGLLAQLLAVRGYASAAVPICSVAPNRMLSFDWGFFRNSVAIANPLKGDEPFPMDADGFHRNFANRMSRKQSDAAFEAYGIPESRNVLRDCMGDLGRIDVERPHVPLLFIGASDDEIIPAALCERNAKAYTDPTSRSDYMEFSGRSHFICGEPRWEDVATYVANWLEESAPVAVARAPGPVRRHAT